MFAPGDIIDRFALLSHVGRGGQADVWLASDRLNGTTVALKLVEVSKDEASNERVRREARALCRVSHPAVLRAFALFEEPARGVIGLALEWVDGADLERMKGVLSQRTKRAALFHTATGLSALHARGIVHRDVKLSNVLVRHDVDDRPTDLGVVKLADLGLATSPSEDAKLTRTGWFVGTLPYIAPELLDPKRFEDRGIHPTLDVFAFGIAGWTLLFGHHPTGLPDDATVLDFADAYRDAAELPDAWPLPRDSHDPVIRALRRALRLNPRERPQTAGELVDAMRER